MTASKPLPEVLSAVVLGPDDRLVLVVRNPMSPEQHKRMQEVVERFIPGGRVLTAAGVDPLVLRAVKAEGSTVGQCGDTLSLPPLILGGAASVHVCHLAYGHTGMHSDGETTWSSPEPVALLCGAEAFLDVGTAHKSRCALPPRHRGRHFDELGRSWTNEAGEQ